jgi:hypothetical protein
MGNNMKVDCHVHSYPLAMPGGKTFWTPICIYGGIKWNDLEDALKKREDDEQITHGVFYGGNDFKVLPKQPKNSYLEKRVLPMMENHLLQLIGVSSWDNLDILVNLAKSKTQIQGIKKITEDGGIAIVDQPRPLYNKPEKETNRVSIKHRGEANLQELTELSEETKQRTFLCYNGMLFNWNRKNAEKTSSLTGIKLLWGSDTILRTSSLFSSYNITKINNIGEILDDPLKFKDLHKGAAPFYNLERIQRTTSAIAEEIKGIEKREKIHDTLIKEWLSEYKI